MKSVLIENNDNGNNQTIIDEINNLTKKGKNVFLFVYMNGCGPCNSTIPQWDNIPNKMNNHANHKDDVVTLRINKDLFPLLKNMGSEPGGFPTLRHVTKDQVDEFEDWQPMDGTMRDRTTDSFIKWIEDKISKQKGVTKVVKKKPRPQLNPNPNKTRKRGAIKKQRGGKWSLKYKKSINCKRPKGFSQRQHCKYGRKRNTGRKR